MNHEDNTGRVQTVRRDQNELYYDLIKAFGERTGIPVILNTVSTRTSPSCTHARAGDRVLAGPRWTQLGAGPFWYEKPADHGRQSAQVIGER